MRTVLIGLAAATLATTWAPDASAVTDAPGCADNVSVATVPVPVTVPATIVPDSRVTVVTPQGYDASDTTTHYPVLYLLHGAGDGYATWVANTDVETLCDEVPMIIVMPDGGGKTSQPGWYSDWADGSRHWETFHVEVLVPWVDAQYRTLADRDHRAVAGLSMGGFGAFSYAGRHPDVFGAAASFSGVLDTMYAWPASGVGFTLAHDQFGTPNDDVWGNQVLDSDEWRAHNPADLARTGAYDGTPFWFATGTGTPGGPAGEEPGNPGGYALEHFIWQMHQSFKASVAVGDLQHGYEYHDDSYVGGLHGWGYWNYEVLRAAPWLYDRIKP